MIQRVQSLFLLVVLSCSIAIFFLPFLKLNYTDHFYTLDTFGLKITTIQSIKVSNFYWISVFINIFICIITLACIASFKNRRFQILLCKINSSIILFLMAFVYYSYEISIQIISETHSEPPVVSLKLGVLFPILAFVFSILSSYYIKKDEELVRSADRIR